MYVVVNHGSSAKQYSVKMARQEARQEACLDGLRQDSPLQHVQMAEQVGQAAWRIGMSLCKSGVWGKVTEHSAGKVAHSYLIALPNLRIDTIQHNDW